jgi:moderate conductance mechanosensitive channel
MELASSRSSGAFRGRVLRFCSPYAVGFAIVVLLSLGQTPPSLGQSTAAPAAAPTPQEEAVRSPPDQSAAAWLASSAGKLEQAAEVLMEDLGPIIAAVPRVPLELSAFAGRVLDPAQGPFIPWFLKLAATFALALGIQAAIRRLAIPSRRPVFASPDRPVPFAMIAGLLARDLLGLIAVAGIAFAARVLWFNGPSVRSALAVPLIAALVHWRALLLLVDLVLRSDVTPARLVDVTDATAARLRQVAIWAIGLQVFSIGSLRALLHAGLALPVVHMLAILIGIGNALVALAFIRRERKAEAAPSGGEIAVTIHRPGHRLLLWVWHPAAILFVILALLTWLSGIVVHDLGFFWDIIDTAGIVIAAWVVETVIARSQERNDAAPPNNRGALAGRWPLMIRRCLIAGIWLVATAFVIRLWLVDRFHVLTMAQWEHYTGSALSIAITLCGAYVLSHVVLAHTEHRLNPLQADSEDALPVNAPLPIASRLQTMLPLLRLFVLAMIGTVAVLVALSALGVNTTSLIAGASIFGLAISFGSQSLVRDIVSGIFFMADDAFRIGEYIDTGKLKGTVEGMSVRSLRLRHQNGQVHVIPFGHIEHVTNFSRDWITTKFNLRLIHGSDLDRVRKTVKQIGVEMMADPEIAPELIQPLKLQGINDIDPGAVIIRLKFTARPAQPTFVHRRALWLIYKRFKERGIEFASNTVLVQTAGQSGATTEEINAAAASGATTLIGPPPTAA